MACGLVGLGRCGMRQCLRIVLVCYNKSCLLHLLLKLLKVSTYVGSLMTLRCTSSIEMLRTRVVWVEQTPIETRVILNVLILYVQCYKPVAVHILVYG